MKREFSTGGVSRCDRMNAELKKEITLVISRKIKNPLITEMWSILDVKVSKDFSYAKVYISVFSTDKEKKERTFSAIVSEAKRIRYELAKSVRARTVPELNFVLDDSMEYGDKMDKILYKIGKGEKLD